MTAPRTSRVTAPRLSINSDLIATLNPATGELLETFDALSDAEVQTRIGRAWNAYTGFRRTSFEDRAASMRAVADLLENEKRRWAALMTTEVGKPIAAAEAEAEKSAWVCRYYADQAEQMLADEVVPLAEGRAHVRYEPLGPVLAIMPWNFPFWQLFRFAAPAIMAGNVVLLKHAPNVPRCALAIEEIFRLAGFPEGVFQTLLIDVQQVASVLEDDRVRAATLTGSVAAGSAVGSHAARLIKPSVLELGGSDPFIVLPSADLDAAVRTGVQSRTMNAGQSCIAAKRFIIHDDIYDQFERSFVARMDSLVVGDPTDPATDVGPLAAAHLRDNLHRQVRDSVAAGARLLCGGEPLAGPGFFYPPTALADLPEGSPGRCEEMFGPVAALFRVRDLDEAIRLANDTVYGLGSSVWTRNEREQRRCMEEIDAGQVFLNAMTASDPRLPFGGVKQSGYGRELSTHGAREFVNVKTVWIATEAAGHSAASRSGTE
jgi:succinate-semialdehyde dehydrogenase / glutarate-semialdehyde dehydrogenase